MIKICYLISSLRRTGPVNQLFYIIKNLDRKKFEPFILTLSPEPLDSKIDDFKKLDIKIIQINMSRIKGIFFLQKEVEKIIDKEKPQIVHSTGIRGDKIALNLMKFDLKSIMSVRNFPFKDYPMKFGTLKGNLMAYAHFGILKSAEKPIACSKNIADEFQNKLKLKMDFINNGVDLDKFFKVSSEEKINLRKKLGINNKKLVFITVGSIISRKNSEIIIKSFQKTDKDRTLVILGDGPLRQNLEEISKDNKNIVFKGQVSNVDEYLKASDFFVSASLAEGMPNTVLEAMACGLPVILSNIEPHKEVVKETNLKKYLFETNDEKKLKNNIDNIFKEDYEQLSTEVVEKIVKHFSAKSMSKQYQNLYEDLIDG